MAAASLRLIKPRDCEPQGPVMERRISGRHTITGCATALASLPESPEHQNRICSFQLLNISDRGLGVIVNDAIEIGAHVSVYFPPHGPEQGIDLMGTVVRCRRRGAGHEIGIALRPRQAA